MDGEAKSNRYVGFGNTVEPAKGSNKSEELYGALSAGWSSFASGASKLAGKAKEHAKQMNDSYIKPTTQKLSEKVKDGSLATATHSAIGNLSTKLGKWYPFSGTGSAGEGGNSNGEEQSSSYQGGSYQGSSYQGSAGLYGSGQKSSNASQWNADWSVGEGEEHEQEHEPEQEQEQEEHFVSPVREPARVANLINFDDEPAARSNSKAAATKKNKNTKSKTTVDEFDELAKDNAPVKAEEDKWAVDDDDWQAL